MASRFGVFDHIENIPGTPTSQLFKDRLELIRMADQAGFAGYHFAEHHGSDLCMAPSQELFIAAASQVTSDIRLGPMVKLLPMHHPVRIIEDMCLLVRNRGYARARAVDRHAELAADVASRELDQPKVPRLEINFAAAVWPSARRGVVGSGYLAARQ